jgi:uncharacterized membrane protein
MNISHNGQAMKAAKQAIKSGDKVRARQLLRQAARQDPGDHQVWLWLAGLAPSPQASLAYIQRAEAILPGDPVIEKARRWAEGLMEQDGGIAQPQVRVGTFAQPDILWSLLGLLVFALVIVSVGWLPFMKPFRLLLGLAFVLYIPGYWLTAALFPGRENLNGIERTGLSLGLSVAVVPLLALILDKLPWGLRLWPILAGEYAATFVFMAAAGWRRMHLPPQLAYIPEMRLQPGLWWRGLTPGDKRLSKFILIALLLAGLATAWIFLVPSPDQFMTDFYMLGPEGLAENFPRQAAPGEQLSLTMGLSNKERESMTYRVEIWAMDPLEDKREKVGESIPITLQPGESIEWPLSWSMPWPGDDQQVEFLLFHDDDPDPYRQLRLWLNVTDQ